MKEETLFILHVANGIYITTYNYMNSNTNTSIIICILVQIPFFQELFNDT